MHLTLTYPVAAFRTFCFFPETASVFELNKKKTSSFIHAEGVFHRVRNFFIFLHKTYRLKCLSVVSAPMEEHARTLRSEVLTAAGLSMLVLWVVSPCGHDVSISEERTTSIFNPLKSLAHTT
jgi:hypothetical protein